MGGVGYKFFWFGIFLLFLFLIFWFVKTVFGIQGYGSVAIVFAYCVKSPTSHRTSLVVHSCDLRKVKAEAYSHTGLYIASHLEMHETLSPKQ